MNHSTPLRILSQDYSDELITKEEYREKRRALIDELLRSAKPSVTSNEETEDLNKHHLIHQETSNTKTLLRPTINIRKILPLGILLGAVMGVSYLYLITNDASDSPGEGLQTTFNEEQSQEQDLLGLFKKIAEDNSVTEQEISLLNSRWLSSKQSEKAQLSSFINSMSLDNEYLESGLTSELLNDLNRKLNLLENPMVTRLNNVLKAEILTDEDLEDIETLWDEASRKHQKEFVTYIRQHIVTTIDKFEFEEERLIISDILFSINIDVSDLYESEENEEILITSSEPDNTANKQYSEVETLPSAEPISEEAGVEVDSKTDESIHLREQEISANTRTNPTIVEPANNIDANVDDSLNSSNGVDAPSTQTQELKEEAEVEKPNEIAANGTIDSSDEKLQNTTADNSNGGGNTENLVDTDRSPEPIEKEKMKGGEDKTSLKIESEGTIQEASLLVPQPIEADKSVAGQSLLKTPKTALEELESLLQSRFSDPKWSDEENLIVTASEVLTWRREYPHILMENQEVDEKATSTHAREEVLKVITRLENFDQIYDEMEMISSNLSKGHNPEKEKYKRVIRGFYRMFKKANEDRKASLD